MVTRTSPAAATTRPKGTAMPDLADLDPDVLGLDVTEWINSEPIDVADLRGRVVLVEAFQMLCPGCVQYGLPQAQRVHRAFGPDRVRVIGLHTVFEHHAVMRPAALRAFVAEYRLPFPVAVDRPVEGRAMPSTMQRYGLEGTPSTIVADRGGRIRHVSLGAIDDLTLGALLGRLLAEAPPERPAEVRAA